MTILARAGLMAALGAAASLAHAQNGPFTAQQAAAGRASYLANCAGCHQPDLRGANEAKPLAGPDFMRTWTDRTAQDLVSFLSVAMPPPPASPGGLGTQTYVSLAAFVLAANGATPGNSELAATTAVRIGSVATGTMTDAFRAALATAGPAVASVGGRTGISVAGNADRVRPVSDADLRAQAGADWLMIRGNYRAWNYSELAQVTRDNVSQLTLQWVWSMTDGGWSEPGIFILETFHPSSNDKAWRSVSTSRFVLYPWTDTRMSLFPTLTPAPSPTTGEGNHSTNGTSMRCSS